MFPQCRCAKCLAALLKPRTLRSRIDHLVEMAQTLERVAKKLDQYARQILGR